MGCDLRPVPAKKNLLAASRPASILMQNGKNVLGQSDDRKKILLAARKKNLTCCTIENP